MFQNYFSKAQVMGILRNVIQLLYQLLSSSSFNVVIVAMAPNM